MDQFKLLENGMLIGQQPTEGDLRQARQEGINTVIDLRLPSETPHPMLNWLPAAAWTT